MQIKDFILSALVLISFSISLFIKSNGVEASSPSLTDSLHLQKWHSFKLTHEKSYSSIQEEAYRFQVFLQSLEIIEANNNSASSTIKLSINKFADMTLQEFSQTYLTTISPGNKQTKKSTKTLSTPPASPSLSQSDSINWVQRGAVGPVPNQGQCGSSWAFGATGAITSAWAIHNNYNVVPLSVEQVNDCTPGSYGCSGGWITGAYDYAQQTPLTTEAEYPYVSQSGAYHQCNQTLAATGQYGVKSYVEDNGDCQNLTNGIFIGPVATASDSSSSAWQFYESGILTNCGNNPNHGILVVGYTPQYWLLQNWWGTSWGMNGYIQIGPGNTCGICEFAAYPII